MTVTKTLHTQHTQHQHSVALVKDHFLAAAASTFLKSPKVLIPAASVPESKHRRWHASWDGRGWVFSTSIYLTVNYLKNTATCTKHPDSRPDPEPLFWEERWKARNTCWNTWQRQVGKGIEPRRFSRFLQIEKGQRVHLRFYWQT